MQTVNLFKTGFLMMNYAEKGDEDALLCGAFYKEVENQQSEEHDL